MVQMRVAKCPTDVLSLKNRVIVNPADQANLLHGAKHVSITTGPGQRFVFSLEPSPEVNPGTLGFSTPQRKWAVLSLNQGGYNSLGLLQSRRYLQFRSLHQRCNSHGLSFNRSWMSSRTALTKGEITSDRWCCTSTSSARKR